MSDDPAAFYDDYGDREWGRLAGGLDGRLEWEGTVAALEESLPPAGHVLDVGGGAGRYAAWLAERGYEVTLVDLSRRQVAVAREKLGERGLADRVRLAQGSVSDLGVAADAADATLCLGGPLSHLLDAADRERAAGELTRVTRPGAPVLVSVMGLLGFVQLKLLTGHNLRALPELLATGDYDADLLDPLGLDNEFTATHLFRREELVDLLSAAGIDIDRVVALEGPLSPLHDEAMHERLADLADEERRAAVETVARLREDSAVVDHSVHMLAIGRT